MIYANFFGLCMCYMLISIKITQDFMRKRRSMAEKMELSEDFEKNGITVHTLTFDSSKVRFTSCGNFVFKTKLR